MTEMDDRIAQYFSDIKIDNATEYRIVEGKGLVNIVFSRKANGIGLTREQLALFISQLSHFTKESSPPTTPEGSSPP